MARRKRMCGTTVLLLLLAMLVQTGFAIACQGHDLAHATGSDIHLDDASHARDHAGDEPGGFGGHDMFHAVHGTAHAPVIVPSVIALPPAPAHAGVAMAAAPPPRSVTPTLLFRPPITA